MLNCTCIKYRVWLSLTPLKLEATTMLLTFFVLFLNLSFFSIFFFFCFSLLCSLLFAPFFLLAIVRNATLTHSSYLLLPLLTSCARPFQRLYVAKFSEDEHKTLLRMLTDAGGIPSDRTYRALITRHSLEGDLDQVREVLKGMSLAGMELTEELERRIMLSAHDKMRMRYGRSIYVNTRALFGFTDPHGRVLEVPLHLCSSRGRSHSAI